MTQLDRQTWLERRRSGIGGSDIAAIAGQHPYKSAWSVYHDKIGTVRDDNAGEAAAWGQAFEQIIAERWHDRHGPEGTKLGEVGWVQHPDHDWWCGTPDFGLWRNDDGNFYVDEAVECKNVGYLAWTHQWDKGGRIPPWIELQCNWYAELLDVDVVHLAVLVNGNHLAEPMTVARNRARCAKLARVAERFWHDNVLARVPPRPDGSERARRELDDLYPAPVDTFATCLTREAADLAVEFVKWRDTEAKAKQIKHAIGQQLIVMLGEAGATDGHVDDMNQPIVTYRPVRKVDFDRIAADHPDALDACKLPPKYSTTELRKRLGSKELASYMTPTEQRRLTVRDITSEGTD